MMHKFQINHPCPEKWEAMAPSPKGKFCDVCSKNVFDFTKMSDEEIALVLNEKKNVCARIPAKNSAVQPIIIRPASILSINTTCQNLVRIFIILIFLNLTISCSNGYEGSEKQPVVLSENEPQTLTGEIMPPPEFKSDTSTLRQNGAYMVVDSMPEFKGGKDSLMHFVETHLQYPAEKQNEEAKIYASFIIDANGRLTQPRIEYKSCQDSKPFEREVMSMLKKMPRWQPGRQDGIRVPVKMILPISFRP